MCFGSSTPAPPPPTGPSPAEIAAANAQREAAARAKRDAIEEKAKQKQDDINEALGGKMVQDGRRGGAGRRSLLTAPSGSGYASRF